MLSSKQYLLLILGMISERREGAVYGSKFSTRKTYISRLFIKYIRLLFSFHNEIHSQIIKELMELSESCFHRSEDLQNDLHKIILSPSDQKIERNPYKLLVSKKSSIISQNLKRRHFQLIFIIHRQVFIYFGGVSYITVSR